MSIPPINQSSLKTAWKKGWKYFHAAHVAKTIPPKSEAYFAVGSAIHLFLLENAKFKDRVVEIPTEVLASNGAKSGNKWKEFEAANEKKILLKTAEMQSVLACVESIMQHPSAMEILAAPAHIEQFVEAEIFGIKARGIPDICLQRGGVVVDVKSTSMVDEYEFRSQVKKLGYHIQAAWYLELCSTFYGKRYSQFVFIAVETEPPYRCRCYYLDEAFLQEGRMIAAGLAEEYAGRYAANDWLEDCDKNIIFIEKGRF